MKQQAARGSDANPLSDRELEDKLRMCAAEWNPGFDVGVLMDAIWGIEKAADVSKLAKMTAVG